MREDKGYGFTPPPRGLSMDGAISFILEGISDCELPEDTFDSDKAIAWLTFCANEFVDEPYGALLVNECQTFIAHISSGEFIDQLSKSDQEDLESKSLADLNGIAAVLTSSGRPREAHNVSSIAVRRALSLYDEWAEDTSTLTFSFENAVDFSMYVAAYGTEKEIVWRDPEVLRAFFVHARVLYDLGEYASALKFYETALELDPVSASVLLEMSECAKRLNDPDKIVEYASEALNWSWTMTMVAKAHRDIGCALIMTNHEKLAAARYIVAADYADSHRAAAELAYIDSLGFDTSSLDLLDSLRITKAEPDGCPVSEVAASAVKTVLESLDVSQNPTIAEKLVLESSKWDRMFRREAAFLES